MKFAPVKIKILTSLVLFILLGRYISLLILFLYNKIQYLYLLKCVFFIFLICSPIMCIISLFILARKDSLNFNRVLIISVVLATIYCFLMIKCDVRVLIQSGTLWYSMVLDKFKLICIGYFVINIILVLICTNILHRVSKKDLGVYVLLIGTIITSIEIVMIFSNIKVLPEAILGESLYILSLNYALSTFKKSTNLK